MEQSPSWESNQFSAGQEIPRILWNQNVHYRIHKDLPPVPILSQINPFPVLHPTSWRSILILPSHLGLSLPSGLIPSGFRTKILYAPFLSPILATYIANVIPVRYITHTHYVIYIVYHVPCITY